eukprot:gene13127-3447_t
MARQRASTAVILSGIVQSNDRMSLGDRPDFRLPLRRVSRLSSGLSSVCFRRAAPMAAKTHPPMNAPAPMLAGILKRAPVCILLNDNFSPSSSRLLASARYTPALIRVLLGQPGGRLFVVIPACPSTTIVNIEAARANSVQDKGPCPILSA